VLDADYDVIGTHDDVARGHSGLANRELCAPVVLAHRVISLRAQLSRYSSSSFYRSLMLIAKNNPQSIRALRAAPGFPKLIAYRMTPPRSFTDLH
jgi:hypothetical protein